MRGFLHLNDKLHSDIIPFFLRENQTYVSGTELKADLANLDRHYDALPDDVKKRGVMSFAFYPPDEPFLVTQLWDKHMSPKRREQKSAIQNESESEGGKNIVVHITRFINEGIQFPTINVLTLIKPTK